MLADISDRLLKKTLKMTRATHVQVFQNILCVFFFQTNIIIQSFRVAVAFWMVKSNIHSFLTLNYSYFSNRNIALIRKMTMMMKTNLTKKANRLDFGH